MTLLRDWWPAIHLFPEKEYVDETDFKCIWIHEDNRVSKNDICRGPSSRFFMHLSREISSHAWTPSPRADTSRGLTLPRSQQHTQLTAFKWSPLHLVWFDTRKQPSTLLLFMYVFNIILFSISEQNKISTPKWRQSDVFAMFLWPLSFMSFQWHTTNMIF